MEGIIAEMGEDHRRRRSTEKCKVIEAPVRQREGEVAKVGEDRQNLLEAEKEPDKMKFGAAPRADKSSEREPVSTDT